MPESAEVQVTPLFVERETPPTYPPPVPAYKLIPLTIRVFVSLRTESAQVQFVPPSLERKIPSPDPAMRFDPITASAFTISA